MSEFIVIGMVVWTFFIASALCVRFREKNAGYQVPSRVGVAAVKRKHRLHKPINRF